MSEKTITAISRNKDGIEWTTRQEGEKNGLRHETLPLGLDSLQPEEALNAVIFPEGLHDKLKGDLIVTLRSSELLLHVMDFPTDDADELTAMVDVQIDKISPFSRDQLAVSHEIMNRNENGTVTVLMAAAKRSCIDAIGDAFEKNKIRVHSIDARILGWLRLMKDEQKFTNEGCETLIIDDTIGYTLVARNEGVPVLFRMLHRIEGDTEDAKELAHEIEYALTTLDAERNITIPTIIHYWSNGEQVSTSKLEQLADISGMEVEYNNLQQLPPLSEGIVRRAATKQESRIELIPSEWIEHVKRKNLLKKTWMIMAGLTVIWLILTSTLSAMYYVRKNGLETVQTASNALVPAANKAQETRDKLETLKTYTDRSASALECLREVTRMLPNGDIEFSSFKYTKNKATTLMGSAVNDDIVYDFFDRLTSSDIFENLGSQRVNTRIVRGKRVTQYTATLELTSKKDEE